MVDFFGFCSNRDNMSYKNNAQERERGMSMRKLAGKSAKEKQKKAAAGQQKKAAAGQQKKAAAGQKKAAAGQQGMVTGEWLYLAAAGMNVRQIADAVEECETELWEDAGVLEIVLGEKSSMDIEQTKVRHGDDVTGSFLAENGCAEIFLVTFAPEEYRRAEEIMRRILSRCGGLFCGDTVDFKPEIR